MITFLSLVERHSYFNMRRDVFQAIADPARRKIIGLIARQSMNVNEIADHFEISRPAVSKHIKILHECGLLIFIKQGRERYCQFQPEKLNEVADWVDHFRDLWEHRLDAFEVYLDVLKENRRTPKSDDPQG